MKKVLYSLFAYALILSSCSESVQKDLKVETKLETAKVSFIFERNNQTNSSTKRSSLLPSLSSEVLVSGINIKATDLFSGESALDKVYSFNEEQSMVLPYGDYDLEVATVASSVPANNVYTNFMEQGTDNLAYSDALSELQPSSAVFESVSKVRLDMKSIISVSTLETVSSRCNIVINTCAKYDLDMIVSYDNNTYTVYKTAYPKSSAVVLNDVNQSGNFDVNITLKKYLHGSTKLIETIPVYENGKTPFKTVFGKNTTLVFSYSADNELTCVKNGISFVWVPMGEEGQDIIIY